MKKIGCFLDIPVYYDTKRKIHVLTPSAMNVLEFLKFLKKELNLQMGFILPLREDHQLNINFPVIDFQDCLIESLPYWHSIISYYINISNLLTYLKLKKMIKELIKKYDFFWIRLPSPFGLQFGEAAEKANKFVLYHIAGDIRLAYLSTKYKKIKILAKLMGYYLHQRSLQLGEKGRFLCTGSVMFDTYKKLGKRVVYFIDSVIKKEQIYKPKEKIGRPVKFLYVGEFLENKGVSFLINAMEKLSYRYQLELHIVGYGPEERKIYKLSKDKKFIKFYGFIPYGKNLLKIYRECDVFVLPTLFYEGFPRVILEAWANGLFVISSKVGGIEGLGKDNENLLFFKRGDETDLISKVQLLIEDDILRNKLKEGINKVQKKITAEYMINKVKKILKQKIYE